MMANTVDIKNPQTRVAMSDHQCGSKKKSTPLSNMFKRCYFQEPLTEFKLRGRCQYFINALFSIFLSFSHFPPEVGYVSNRPGVGKRGPQNKLCCLYSYGPWAKNSFIFSNVKRKEETKRINVPHPMKVIWNANINVLLFGFIWTSLLIHSNAVCGCSPTATEVSGDRRGHAARTACNVCSPTL